ncbi:MAG: NADH-quinone oxidoreductase subunit 5 family protein, partial [Candidatus Saccharimonadales bacterium]
CSQLGYMFVAMGVGAYSVGMFHLFTHAFFKSLLFLSAGSVMHAMGNTADMRRFSGLRRIMPWTCLTFLAGCLALSGVVPFAGFWSKDAILAAAREGGAGYHDLYQVLYYVGLFTALLTAIYTFRGFFLTFYGETRVPPEAGHHAHEAPPVMLVPLVILAVCALVVGSVNWEFSWPFGADALYHFLLATPSLAYAAVPHAAHEAGGLHFEVQAVSTITALTGIGIAAFLYLGDRRQLAMLTRWTSSIYGLRLYQLSYGKFFFDGIYSALVVWPLWFLALLSYWFDRWIVDGLVNLLGKLPVAVGSMLRSLQNGMVQFYALAMVLGLLVLVGTLLMWPAM